MSIFSPKLTEKLYVFGKYLDQPAILKNLEKAVPNAAFAAAAGFGVYDVFKAPKEEKKKTAVRDFFVLSFALGAAFLTTKGLKIAGKKIIPGIEDLHEKMHKHVDKAAHAAKECGCHDNKGHAGHKILKLIQEKTGLTKTKKEIDELNKQNLDGVAGLLDKLHRNAKLQELSKKETEIKKIIAEKHGPLQNLIHKVSQEKEILSLKEIHTIKKETDALAPGQNLITDVIPDSHQHNPWGELGYLSLMGTVPVLGGVAGGVMADKINGENIKEGAKDKIKEGIFQYLANITLCNAGAGLAMVGLESAGIKNKAARFTGMMAGVVTVGMLFGGTIANYIGKKFVNPMLEHKKSDDMENHHRDIINLFKHVNEERKPEPLDLALHIDDVASVGFLSGLKWIGPILPALYSVSGYRAGIGYRNGEVHSHGANHSHHKTFEDYKLAISA